eukprot:jgi/Chrzof1/13767/Cz08g11130.t1
MWYEAAGKEQDAEEVYKQILKEQPSNELAAKRLVALQKTKGHTLGAIDSLRWYLDTFMNDKEAWEELAELYLEASMYRQAAFCYEELLTINPMNAIYHIRYADTLFTLGGAANIRTARAYYSKAIQVSAGRSIRAIYGLLACCTHAPDKDNDRVLQHLPAAAADMLLTLYKQQAKDKVPIVEQMLQQQGFLPSATKD